jgi:hypothetical protein
MQKKYSPSIILGIALGFVLFGYTAFADFKPPTVAPPGGNVKPPINTGDEPQIKDGAIVANAYRSGGDLDDNPPDTGMRVFGYFQLDKGGTPPGTECDDNGDRGRMFVNINNNRLYICMASGWKYKKIDNS